MQTTLIEFPIDPCVGEKAEKGEQHNKRRVTMTTVIPVVRVHRVGVRESGVLAGKISQKISAVRASTVSSGIDIHWQREPVHMHI